MIMLKSQSNELFMLILAFLYNLLNSNKPIVKLKWSNFQFVKFFSLEFVEFLVHSIFSDRVCQFFYFFKLIIRLFRGGLAPCSQILGSLLRPLGRQSGLENDRNMAPMDSTKPQFARFNKLGPSIYSKSFDILNFSTNSDPIYIYRGCSEMKSHLVRLGYLRVG